MKLQDRLNDVSFLFTALRAMCVLFAVLGLFVLGVLIDNILPYLSGPYLALAVISLIAGVALAVCCCAVLILFYRMCGRIRGGASFTETNVKALWAIALFLFVGGCVAALEIIALFAWFGVCLPVIELSLVAAAFFVCALLSKALDVLLSRAVTLKQENDLTI